jgi:hypothetical protein
VRAMGHRPCRGDAPSWIAKPALNESVLYVTHMGAAAQRLLARGHCGQVLAAFSDVVYLLSASGELAWVASVCVPLHQRCLKVSAPLPRLARGTPFSVQDHCLKMDSGVVLDSAAATLWEAPQVIRNQVVAISEIPRRVCALASGLHFSQARGLAALIPSLLGCAPDSAAATDDAVMARARPLVLQVADACRSHDRQRIALGADALIGFGGGLTPSGDDLVGGLLFGLKTLRTAYPGMDWCDLAISAESYRTRTHLISFTLLSDLADGHAIAPVHDIMNGILGGAPLEGIHLAISQLTQVGHSTGWDLLAGLFVALLMAECNSRDCSDVRGRADA